MKSTTPRTEWPKVEDDLERKRAGVLKRTVTGTSPVLEERELKFLKMLGVNPAKALADFSGALVTDEERALYKLQREDAFNALKRCGSVTREIVQANALSLKLADRASESTVGAGALLETVKALRERVSELRAEYSTLAGQSPEAFLAVHARELRAWKRQLESGRIARTPYVTHKIDQISDNLRRGFPVLVHGETGIGKTEIAKIAARLATGKEPIVVRGYSGMGSTELFGHMTLGESGVKRAMELPGKIQKELDAYDEANPPAIGDPQKRAAAHENIITHMVSQGGATVTEYVLGAAYRAAAEGRTLILDEANYIPPALLAKLNDILTKKPGEFINVQEDGVDPIEVKSGFSLILTGNINLTQSGDKKYRNRFELDPALLDRVMVVPYDYLPQARAGQSKDYGIEDKQLYAVMLTALLNQDIPRDRSGAAESVSLNLEDRVGTMVLPGGPAALDSLWKLAMFAAVTEDAFAAKITDKSPHAFQLGRAAIGLKPELCLSPRALIRLLKDWQSNGYDKELDHYIHKHLIARALRVQDQAYLYQLGQQFGFFNSPGWSRPDLSTGSLPQDLHHSDPENSAPAPEIISGGDVVEALFGEAPKRNRFPDAAVQVKAMRQDAAARAVAIAAGLAQRTKGNKALLAKHKFLEELREPSPKE